MARCPVEDITAALNKTVSAVRNRATVLMSDTWENAGQELDPGRKCDTDHSLW